MARATGNHLLVQVKENQPSLLEAIRSLTANAEPAEAVFNRFSAFRRNACQRQRYLWYRESGKGRARQEDRTVEVFPAGNAFVETEWQPFVKTIIRVTRRTLLRSAATGMWAERGEVAYYISSAADLPATAWAAAIRGHWGIENRHHYVRDVSCDEDRSRIRDNPGIMARARSFALNILRKNGVTNVAQALWTGALSLDHILAYKAI